MCSNKEIDTGNILPYIEKVIFYFGYVASLSGAFLGILVDSRFGGTDPLCNKVSFLKVLARNFILLVVLGCFHFFVVYYGFVNSEEKLTLGNLVLIFLLASFLPTFLFCFLIFGFSRLFFEKIYLT